MTIFLFHTKRRYGALLTCYFVAAFLTHDVFSSSPVPESAIAFAFSPNNDTTRRFRVNAPSSAVQTRNNHYSRTASGCNDDIEIRCYGSNKDLASCCSAIPASEYKHEPCVSISKKGNWIPFHSRRTAHSTSANTIRRRDVLWTCCSLTCAHILSIPCSPAKAKCTDIDTCREIGDMKIAQDLKDNPIVNLDAGVRYKVLRPGTGIDTVDENSNIDLIFSVSRLGAGYMFSRGFGYEKLDGGNGKMISDAGIDSIRVKMGNGNVPVGIEYALVGMKKGERRRVELPAKVGFETSGWQPEPLTGRGKASLKAYKRLLEAYRSDPSQGLTGGVNTVWDIEVLRIRNKD